MESVTTTHSRQLYPSVSVNCIFVPQCFLIFPNVKEIHLGELMDKGIDNSLFQSVLQIKCPSKTHFNRKVNTIGELFRSATQSLYIKDS